MQTLLLLLLRRSLLAVELRPEIEGICQDLLLSCEAGVRDSEKEGEHQFSKLQLLLDVL